MKKKLSLALIAALSLSMSACSAGTTAETTAQETTTAETTAPEKTDDESQRGTGEQYTATNANEHAIDADGTEENYDNIGVTKTGDADSGDESDFYGTNAAVIAQNGGKLTISNSKICTDAAYGNAVFAYGEGSTVDISDSTIETSEHNSGGIMVTGGGTLNANNLHVTTQGGSSAAIRSDRGGGTIIADGGYYETNGSGSPAIYSTADITVNDAVLDSKVAQAVVVEGKNSVTINDSDVTGDNTVQNSDKTDLLQAVMIYQSMSGDADTGKGTFTMNGGTLTSKNGGMFFVTNTVAEINLNNVKLNYATDDLLRIQSEGWGNEDENGGQVTLNAKDQNLSGIITLDANSNLNMYLSGDSVFNGSIDNSGKVYVEIADGSTWTLTADTSITSLTCGKNAIKLNGHKLTVGGTEYKEGTESTGEAIETVVYESHGAPDMQGGAPNGQAPDGKGASEGGKPDGQTPPEKPAGDNSSANANGGQAPDGQMAPPDNGNGQTPPEKPDGNGQPQEGETPPAKPDSDNSQTPPEKPAGES